MTEQKAANATVEVRVDPATAFKAYTDELDCWWVRGPINFFDAARAVEMRMEPGIGGRVLEIYDSDLGDVLELGRITVWEPGSRLVYRCTVDDTEVDVRFDPVEGGTRVHVRQYVVPGGDPDRAFLFWPRVIGMFVAWCRDRDATPHRAREAGRLGVAVYYEDTARAARWLARTFGLKSRYDAVPSEGESPEWIELHVGDASLMLFPRVGRRDPNASVTHVPWVHVDDLDVHFAHASANGATIIEEIHQHGYRAYVAEDHEGHRWTFAQARPTMR